MQKIIIYNINPYFYTIVKLQGILSKQYLKYKLNFKDFSTYLYKHRKQLYSTLISIIKGYKILLNIKGFGFRTEYKYGILSCKVGYSSIVFFKKTNEIQLKRIKKKSLKLYGIYKQNFLKSLNDILYLRKPSVYRDKGILVRNFKIKYKQGKKSKY